MSGHQHQIPIREDWLASTTEAILDPGQRIIDPHHHLWERAGWRYLLDEMLADIRSGHDVRATVLVQSSRSFSRATGPEAMRPVGETEFAAGVAAMGLERIDFLWYARKFSVLALLGYAAGAAVYLLQVAVQQG